MVGHLFTYRARRVRPWALCVLFILMAASAASVVSAREQLPVAKIVSVEYPSDISPEENLTVLVTVDYSESYSTDIAIVDAATGFVLASRGLIIPAGKNMFTFSVPARDQPGAWALAATVRIWWHNGWYANQDGGTFPFVIMVTDQVLGTLSIKSNLTSAVVKVDEIAHTVSLGGIELSATRGFHRIEVESPVFLSDETRVVFDHWSDGIRSSPREIYLTSKVDLTALYVTELLLKVQSPAGETVGSGWYRAGMNATFAALDPSVTEHSCAHPEVRYKFSHWSGDSDSPSPIGWIVMDQPKTVIANWSEGTSQITLDCQLLIPSLVFFSCSAILIAIGFVLRHRPRTKSHYVLPTRRDAQRVSLLVLVFLAAFMHSPAAQPSHALTLLQPESITIGDAVWYHWNQAASDTLLIWLGGGIVEQTGFLVNPYEFESYNTMRFIQDLAEYYDVLALKKGSVRSVDSTLNKTVFSEPYPSSNDFIEKIRLWAGEQGYVYLHIVGYSVGAMVAATELILANPAKWTTPNGLIIITTKIPDRLYPKIASLRASLLLLYGDKVAPEFTASGQRFFQSTPEEGWRDGFRYHKEYHVIPDVEHEVWTIKDSGEYDRRAILLTVRFIETTKGLQFERFSESISRIGRNLTANTEPHTSFQVQITSVNAPAKVRTGEAFKITATVRYELSSNLTIAVVAFDTGSGWLVSASERRLYGSGEAQFVTTLLPGDAAARSNFSLIPLVATENEWNVVTEGVRNVLIDVSNSFAITLVIGYPNVTVEFDGQKVLTGTNGDLTLNAAPGEHLITVPPIMMLGNTSRAVFYQWNDSDASPTRHLTASSDVTLLAIYRKQHHLSVASPLSQTTGTGWYDENAIAWFNVAPPVLFEQTSAYVFTGWSGDSSDPSPASSIFVDAPKNIQASWKELKHGEENSSLLRSKMLFTLSLATLLASLIFVVKSTRSRRELIFADLPPPSNRICRFFACAHSSEDSPYREDYRGSILFASLK